MNKADCLNQYNSVQLVYSVPRARYVQGYICSAALEEGGVEMVLQVPGGTGGHCVGGVCEGDGGRGEREGVHFPGRLGGGQPRRTGCNRPSTAPALGARLPWHMHRAIRKILASPSSQPPLYPRPSTSRQAPADSLSQTRPQSTQRSVPRDLISGQISTIGISTRRAPQRSPRLLLPTFSPRSSSTPRRG